MAHVAAKVVGLKTPTKSAKRLPRKEGAKLLTLSRWKVVTVYLKKLMLACLHRLPHGGMDRLKTKFLDLNLTARLVQRIVEC